MIKYDEIICYEYCINKNALATTSSINSVDKKRKFDCYILYTVLLGIILLLIITIIAIIMENIGQNKKTLIYWQYKMENNEF